jgi:flagellar biosynthesis chaperone FliJ
MKGIYPFLCDEANVTLFETEEGWAWPQNPSFEVREAERGWRMEQESSGAVGYLQSDRDGWTIKFLSEDEYQSYQCLDLTISATAIIDVILPRLNENIAGVLDELARLKEEHSQGGLLLAETMDSVGRLTAERNELRQRLEGESNELRQRLEEKNRNLALAKNTIYEQSSLIAELENRVDHSVSEIRHLSAGLERTQLELEESRLEVDRVTSEYLSVLSSAKGSEAILPGEYLESLVEMSPTERNVEIRNSSLSGDDIIRGGSVDVCVRRLRDKAKLSGDCKLTLVEALVSAGSY